MTSTLPIRRRPAALALTLAAAASMIALAHGCGDDTGLGRRYPISGTVTYNGAPVPKGEITFYPEDAEGGRSASGTITDGKYQLTTAVDGDGALPGKYRVAVNSKDVDLSKAQANVSGGSLRQDDLAKANKTAKNLVPPKYNLPDTSGLAAEVTSGSNIKDFDLTD